MVRGVPTSARSKTATGFRYDVSLSFAGEDRGYVEAVAGHLVAVGVRVFYDRHEKVNLWGKDLYSYLDDVYSNAARYCVVFVSKAYAKKLWTNHERRSAQARAFRQNQEYILPARFDNTKIPGIRTTIGYIDLRTVEPHELAQMVVEKLGPRRARNYFPPNPDLLYRRLRAKTALQKERAAARGELFLEALMHMSGEERRVIAYFLLYGCVGELPRNLHVSIDLLRRYCGYPSSKIIRLLQGLLSLGFEATLSMSKRGDCSNEKGLPIVVLEYEHLRVQHGGPAIKVLYEIVQQLRETLCDECCVAAIQRGDFSALSSATIGPDAHEVS